MSLQAHHHLAIHLLQEKWKRELTDHEKNVLIQGFQYGSKSVWDKDHLKMEKLKKVIEYSLLDEKYDPVTLLNVLEVIKMIENKNL